MTNENQNETKRNNRASDIVTLDMHNQGEVIAELQKMQETVLPAH